MEYNLIKTIQPNLHHLIISTHTYPRLTPYPACNFVNPGMGNIAKLYSFYVPLFNDTFPHLIQKKSNLEDEVTKDKSDQIGGGNEKFANEEKLKPEPSQDETENDDSNPIEFNDSKRAKLGDVVQNAFLHPKFVTKTLELPTKEHQKKNSSPQESNSYIASTKSGNGVKKRKHTEPVDHKFQFY
jgi:hypothetical protein